jgi:hypothetical protein
LKKIVAMTQTEGNHVSDRRQTQDFTSISKVSPHTQEGVRQEMEAEKQREEELLSSKQAEHQILKKIVAMTMTNKEDNGSSDTRHCQGITSSGKAFPYTQPRVGEDTRGKSSANKKKSSSGGGSGRMGLTEKDYAGHNRHEEDVNSGHQNRPGENNKRKEEEEDGDLGHQNRPGEDNERKEEKDGENTMMEENIGVSMLSQSNGPTPKESTMMYTDPIKKEPKDDPVSNIY